MYRLPLLISLVVFASISHAGMIDFDSQPDGVYWRSSFTDNGFVFTSYQNDDSIGTGSSVDDEGFDNGTVHLFDWTNSDNKKAKSSFLMAAADQSLFALNGFDFISGYLDGDDMASELKVRGYDANDDKVAELKFKEKDDDYAHTYFTYLSLDESFTNLSYVKFETKGEEHRAGYDNFDVTQQSVSIVREPASLGLLGIGILALVYLNRKNS